MKHLLAFLKLTTPLEPFCSPLVDYKTVSAEKDGARREIEILQKTSKTSPTQNHSQQLSVFDESESRLNVLFCI